MYTDKIRLKLNKNSSFMNKLYVNITSISTCASACGRFHLLTFPRDTSNVVQSSGVKMPTGQHSPFQPPLH